MAAPVGPAGTEVVLRVIAYHFLPLPALVRRVQIWTGCFASLRLLLLLLSSSSSSYLSLLRVAVFLIDRGFRIIEASATSWRGTPFFTVLCCTIPFPTDITSPLVDDTGGSFDDRQSILWISTSLDSLPRSFLGEFCILLVIYRSASSIPSPSVHSLRVDI